MRFFVTFRGTVPAGEGWAPHIRVLGGSFETEHAIDLPDTEWWLIEVETPNGGRAWVGRVIP